MEFFDLLIMVIGHLHTVSAVNHSLKHFVTGVSVNTNIPEFTAVGLLDHFPLAYFDSNTKTVVPRSEWINANVSDYWDKHNQLAVDARQYFKNKMPVLKKLFNQSMPTGAHVLQVILGCGLDDQTGVTGVFFQLGYDGEDFLLLNQTTWAWIALKPQAVSTKLKWDTDEVDNEFWKYYLTQECINFLKKFLDYGRSSLMRTAVPPSVSLLQKTPSSPVTCHATGFYPNRVNVTWKKDGQERHEDVEIRETLPNDDGTFQKSVHLTVKPEEWKNHKYQCVVQVSGIQEDFIKDLTEDEIQTNRDQTPTGLIIGVVVSLILATAAAVIGVVIWKKKTSEGASNYSAPEAQGLSES
ncbi:hypothetical protein DPEC_G00201500 [Dallia pectoralis]|uniref:Uncharacterized protein n=1 Tax=Dallia pectoralis TaxID=75939 RepID=A0ACC2G9G6_DALPE|nr:hypothetical protein DPEC_G00201500 [Dallia pectoralis]